MNKKLLKNYCELFDHITTNYKNEHFLNFFSNDKYENISIENFKNKVICLSLALKDIGVKSGDRIGIFANSSPFWLIFDFAIHQVGAISVPMFANISTQNLNFEIKDSNIKYIFIDCVQRLKDIENENSNLIFITHKFCIKEKNFYNLDEILVIGQQICDSKGFETFKPKEDDIFSIIYTSGNTGTPKGVMLSHKNIMTQINDINSLIKLEQNETALSLLPLAHIFERTVMSYYLSRGISIYFVDDISNTAKLLKIVRPTIMTAVPRLLEKIYFKIINSIESKSLISKTIASLAFNYASKENINKNSIFYKIYDKLVYSKLREIFGSRLNKLISGGALLQREIALFFNNIDVPTYQGYGLSEFSPVVCTNYPNANKIGSCGKVMPSAQIKINQNKELLIKGDSLMKGYLNQEELTKKSIDEDGWFHTGDIAFMDKDGYVYINSRIKDIFKTSTGEYVNAISIEQKISKNPYIEFAVIIAENRKYTTALLFVDKQKFEDEKKAHKNLTIEEYYKKEEILRNISKHIENVNEDLNSWEKIVKFELITNDISIESGELTPSLKICRNKIEEKYKKIINAMYN